MSAENRYDRRNVDNMEMLYGRGFLSGGGPAEVERILTGIDLRDADVLDLGCGLGGAMRTMIEQLDARHVTGFDIDANNLRAAGDLLGEIGAPSRWRLMAGEPGPLPFDDDSFDVVYVNAVSCHLEDLTGFFAEVRRVLRRGGVLAGAEWLVAEPNDAFRGWDDLLRERGLTFFFVDGPAFGVAVEAAGLADLALTDRTDAFTEYSRESLERTDVELRPALTDSLGVDGFDAFRRWCEVRYVALRDGGLRQTHFRARKPERS